MPCLEVTETQVFLHIKALPGASASQAVGVQAGRLRVKIAAPPEKGKANAELCGFFAKLLKCPKKSVTLASGETSRLKTLAFPLSLKDTLERLLNDHTETVR